jgi:signal transduction histidine kinase
VRLRDEFIALAAHELATPFAALRLRAEALARGQATGRTATAAELERLTATVARLGDVIDALGDFSRASRDGIPLEHAVVDLAEITRVAAERVSVRARTDATGTPVRVTAAAPVVGEWDGRRLEQAVANLLENAVKFGRGKPVEVVVSELDGEARVSVRDHGPGIADADRERIFDRYERAASPQSHGGLGLGLWMVRAIAEAHGGTVEVDGEAGAGATFMLVVSKRLPVEA